MVGGGSQASRQPGVSPAGDGQMHIVLQQGMSDSSMLCCMCAACVAGQQLLRRAALVHCIRGGEQHAGAVGIHMVLLGCCQGCVVGTIHAGVLGCMHAMAAGGSEVPAVSLCCEAMHVACVFAKVAASGLSGCIWPEWDLRYNSNLKDRKSSAMAVATYAGGRLCMVSDAAAINAAVLTI